MASRGAIEAIFVGTDPGGPMRPVEAVQARAGLGLEGDRYWQGEDRPARKRGPDREVTLIEAEALEAATRDEGVEIAPAECRRNLVTRGVALNHLVGREFRVAGIPFRGVRLCEPCGHLESLTRPGVREALVHRGGLRAQILGDGPVRVGDPVDV